MAVSHEWEKAQHQVAILGSVTTAQTQEPMEDIRVEITAGPPEFMERVSFLKQLYGEETWGKIKDGPDRTRTARDGSYYFMDLPVGGYTLQALCPKITRRFGNDAGTATVSQGSDGIVWDRVNFQLPATTLEGKVTSDADGEGIHMAEVRILGSGEEAFSDSDGNYALVGIEYGERKVSVEAIGFHGKAVTVMIATAGAVEPKDFSLTPISPGG